MPDDPECLAQKEIHLWMIDLDQSACDPETLSQDEEARAARFVRPQDRRRFRVAHSSVRGILGRYLRQPAASLAFESNTAGKPFLQGLGRSHGIFFNLAHSDRHALLAVTSDREVGVDIEIARVFEDLPGMARQIMSSAEWHRFRSIPPESAHDAFFGLWTRKEALLKAVGTGFLSDPREVNLGLANNETAVVTFRETIWSVEPVAIVSWAKAAIAVEGALPVIRIFRWDTESEQAQP